MTLVLAASALVLLAGAPGAERAVDEAAREVGFRGVVRVERDGRLLVEKAYGGRDPGAAFWIASVTKSFTATLVLRLAERKALRLDDELSRWLPDAPPGRRAIRIDELLTHTAGLPRGTYEAEGIADAAEAGRRILSLPAGKRGAFAYTNDGYALLAIVAERAGGAPYFDLLRREVLEPAGLSSTGLWPGCVAGARVLDLREPPAGARARESWGFKGGIGLCSTAADLAGLFRALASGSLLSPASLDLAWGEAVPISSGHAGRGFFVSRSAGGARVVWTRGTEEAGHNAAVKWFPGERVLLVVLSDVPEPRASVPAPSRALADRLEGVLPSLR